MIFDASFWVAVSFIFFILIAYKPFTKIFVQFLDQRLIKVKSELEEMNILKNEAEEVLQEYLKRQEQVEFEIKQILKNLEREVSLMKENATKEIDSYLSKRSAQVIDRICAHQAKVLEDLRNEAINNTIKIISVIIKENMTEQVSKEVLRNALSDISKQLH